MTEMITLPHAAESRDQLARPASVVVGHALRLKPGEKLVVLCDAPSRPIAYAIVDAARACSVDAILADLDDLGARPHKIVPDAWSFALALAQASVFVASAPKEELPMRQHLLHLVAAHRLRHAHMPGITEQLFVRGVRLGDERSLERAKRVRERLSTGHRLEATSALGTRLSIDLTGVRWFSQLGVLEPGRWGNLPAGALYSSPPEAGVEGELIVNASLGEWFGRREGVLEQKPVRMLVRAGRVVEVRAPHSRQLERDIEALLAVSPSSARIGLACVGVNEALEGPFGDPLVDQNLPGLHLGVGDPAARITGARWSSPTSFAACQFGASVAVDGVPVIAAGRMVVGD